MYIAKLKEMFERMVVQKDASLIPFYYHKEFLLYTNDQVTDYDAFLASHIQYYQTPIQYQVEYDEEAWVESGHKVAGRVFITTSRPNEMPKRIEVILIVQFQNGQIDRLWELTYPDWSALPAFQEQRA